MKEIHSNFNIIGGGLIGLVSAYSLSKLGYNITLLEKNDISGPNKKNTDFRTVAISEGTKNFLDQIKLWKYISPLSEPIKKIKVIDRKLNNYLEFDNKRRESNLGYIVKNKNLINIFYKHLRQKKNVRIFNNINIKDIEFHNEHIVTNSDNLKFLSDLNIAADGKNSFIRKLFKTPFFTKAYNKKALVITFTHTKSHNNTAYEFFYKNGPLAILPMQKDNNYYTSSIVWTNYNKYFQDLINLDPNEVNLILNQKTQSAVGDVKKIISKQIFPLSAHLNSRFYEKRTIYIGDSAHSFHPIAGQGWNLGMKDVQNLFNLAINYKSLGILPGGFSFCKKYHDENFYEAYRLYQITDKLDNIFQIDNRLFAFLRSSSLNLIQHNKKIKDLISDFAMGVN